MGIERISMSNNNFIGGSASTNRSALGLIIGTDVQSYSANLDSLSAFTTDTDSTLAANSDTRLATQKATKSYADTKIASTEKGANSGVATLDSGGKVPAAQLPNSIMDYQGTWSAATNTPTLSNGTGNAGDVYINTAAGTVDFGAGGITFAVGDWTIYSGSVWQKSINSNAVVSVNSQTGAVTFTAGTGLSLTGTQYSIDSTVVTLSGSQTLTNKSIAASQLTGQASVANGGTGASTLTQYGVVVGNGASAVSVTAAGTAKHVLTGNGSANPTFQALPTATSGTSVLSSAFNLSSSSGTYEDIGLSVTLPSAGTYWVSYTLFGQIQIATGTDGYFNAKLYNSTDAADVANSTVIFCYQRLAENINALESVTMSMPITVADSKIIKVYVSRNNGTTYSYSAVESNSTGYSSISYFKLSN